MTRFLLIAEAPRRAEWGVLAECSAKHRLLIGWRPSGDIGIPPEIAEGLIRALREAASGPTGFAAYAPPAPAPDAYFHAPERSLGARLRGRRTPGVCWTTDDTLAVHAFGELWGEGAQVIFGLHGGTTLPALAPGALDAWRGTRAEKMPGVPRGTRLVLTSGQGGDRMGVFGARSEDIERFRRALARALPPRRFPRHGVAEAAFAAEQTRLSAEARTAEAAS